MRQVYPPSDWFVKPKVWITKRPPGGGAYVLDPAGLAPASLLIKGSMLLYTPRARIQYDRKYSTA